MRQYIKFAPFGRQIVAQGGNTPLTPAVGLSTPNVGGFYNPPPKRAWDEMEYTYIRRYYLTNDETGEIAMTTETRYEPAVFPLNGVVLDPPIFVRCLRTKGVLKAGSHQHISHVRYDGKVAVVGEPGAWYDMDMFVQLFVSAHEVLTEPPANLQTAIAEEAANDNNTVSHSTPSKKK